MLSIDVALASPDDASPLTSLPAGRSVPGRGSPGALRTRALRAALGVAGVASFAGAVFNRPGGVEGDKNLVLLPIMTVTAFGLLLWHRRRADHEARVAVAAVAVFMVYLLFEMLFALFVLGDEPGHDILHGLFPLVAWTLGMLVLAFILMDAQVALRVSGSFVLMSLGLLVGYAFKRGAALDSMEANALAQAFVFGPTFSVVLLRVVVGVSEALSAAKVEARAFAGLAATDELTRLPNRRAALTALRAALADRDRNGSTTAVVMIDLDHFKKVNDQHGHDAGDDALIHAANVMAMLTRGTDTLSRWGGEEFLLVCSARGPINLPLLCERFRKALESTPVPDRGFTLTASLGAAQAGADESAESVVRRADEALYAAKAAGRNRAVIAG